MKTSTPDVLIFDNSRHARPAPAPMSEAELTAAVCEEVAWQQFSADWQAQGLHNRQLLLGLTLHSKSTFAHNQLFSQQMRELLALQAEFASQREALAAATRHRYQQQGTQARFLRQLGF